MAKRRPIIAVPKGTTERATRTVVQLGIGGFLMEGFDLFFPDATTADQEKWLALALTAVVSWAQNLIEERANRRLIGARNDT